MTTLNFTPNNSKSLISVGGIFLVEKAHEGGEFQNSSGDAREGLRDQLASLHHLVGGDEEIIASQRARTSSHLHFTSLHSEEHHVERVAYVESGSEDAVVTEEENVRVAHIFHQSLLLLLVHHNSLIVMIANRAYDVGSLGEFHISFLGCANACCFYLMSVRDSHYIMTSSMDGRVDDEAGLVDPHQVTNHSRMNYVSFKINLNEGGRGNFVVIQPQSVDEEMLLSIGPMHAHRSVIVNALSPAEFGVQTVHGSELNAKFGFFLTEFMQNGSAQSLSHHRSGEPHVRDIGFGIELLGNWESSISAASFTRVRSAHS